MKNTIQFILHNKIIAIIVSLVTIGLISSAIIFLNSGNSDENMPKQPNLNTQEEAQNYNEEQNNNQEQDKDIREEQPSEETENKEDIEQEINSDVNNNSQTNKPNNNTSTTDTNNKPTNNIPNNEDNNSQEIEGDNTQDNQVTQKAILCDAWDDINIIYPNQSFITNDYDYYVFDTERLYSNNQNCKKLNPEGVKIKKCLRGYCIAEDNRIYNYNMENVDAPWMQNSFQNNTIILQDTYATLKNDGKIYLSDYEMYDEDEILLEIEINDENIIMFYGITRRLAPIVIKTNKAFYVYNSYIANEEECQKYKDIECKLVQEYVKEPTLSQHYQNIVWVNDKVYITKDKKIHYY